MLWAQGYVYGDDGKRTATVDSNGLVTLYEYNRQGQLSSVLYPYSSELVEILKTQAQENGLAVQKEIGENRFLTASERADIVPLLDKMQYGLSFKLTNLQVFIKESFVYDSNSNRVSKTNSYGTISYTYDAEDHLLFSGANGKTIVKYSYDRNGNLLTRESVLKTVKYTYNSQNRLNSCEVIDNAEKKYLYTSYAYDAFGRRVMVQDKGKEPVYTVYDGFTFDVIKQGTSRSDNAYSTMSKENTGRPTGDRYRYIDDDREKNDDRYFYLDEGMYKSVSTRYQGDRIQININNSVAVQATSEGLQYFTTDISGSVSSISDGYGYQQTCYTYDAFGTLIQGNLSGSADFGYLSKQQDPTSNLYNYGYRDYDPSVSRFTTQDPICDGPNWFTYCSADPINFVDLWGLDQIPVTGNTVMQDKEWRDINLTNSKYIFAKFGCAVIAVSDMLSVSPELINEEYVENGIIQWYKIAQDNGTTVDKQNLPFSKETFYSQEEDLYNNYQTLVNVNYDKDNHDHWVGVKGIKTIGKEDYVIITPTSINDKMTTYDTWNYYGNNDGGLFYSDSRLEKGWKIVNGEVLVPVSETKGYVNFTEKKKGK